MYQSALRAAEQEIQQETRRLEELEAEAEKRREAMVEAKKETSSIEKLKEKKLEAYHKEEARSCSSRNSSAPPGPTRPRKVRSMRRACTVWK